MINREKMFGSFACFALIVAAGSSHALFGGKELETEKIAVNFAREVEKGGYRITTTEELKAWIDQKKDVLIVDTMPYEESYRKQHIPGAVQFEFSAAEGGRTGCKETGGLSSASRPRQEPPDRDLLRVCSMPAQP